MKFPVDSLDSVDPKTLEQSAKDYMSELLHRNPVTHDSLILCDSKIDIDLCNVGFMPLYGGDTKQKVLALFPPEDRFNAVGLYLLGQWWSAEDILKTSDSSRTGLLKVQTPGERIVLYVLNRIIYRTKEKDSDDVPFLCHGEHEVAKILWKNGKAIGFYSVKPEGRLCSSFLTQCFQLPVMDTIFIRKCYRGKGYGLQLLEDFVSSFRNDCLGLKYPLSPAMYKVCKNYFSTYPAHEELLWEVGGVGSPFPKTLIAKKLKTKELKGNFQVTDKVNIEREDTDIPLEATTQVQKTMEYIEEVVEEVIQTKLTKEVQDTPVKTHGRSSRLKRKKLGEYTEVTAEKITRVEDIEAGVQFPVKAMPEVVKRVKEERTVTVTHGEENVLDHHCEEQKELINEPKEIVLEVCAQARPTTEPVIVTPEEAPEKTELSQMSAIKEAQSSEKTEMITIASVDLQPLELQQVVDVKIAEMTTGIKDLLEKNENLMNITEDKGEEKVISEEIRQEGPELENKEETSVHFNVHPGEIEENEASEELIHSNIQPDVTETMDTDPKFIPAEKGNQTGDSETAEEEVNQEQEDKVENKEEKEIVKLTESLADREQVQSLFPQGNKYDKESFAETVAENSTEVNTSESEKNKKQNKETKRPGNEAINESSLDKETLIIKGRSSVKSSPLQKTGVEVIENIDKGSIKEREENNDEKMETENSVVSKDDECVPEVANTHQDEIKMVLEVETLKISKPLEESPGDEEIEVKDVNESCPGDKEEKTDNWTDSIEEKYLDKGDKSCSKGRPVDSQKSSTLRRSQRFKDQPAESGLTERVLRSGTKSVTSISKHVQHTKPVKNKDEVMALHSGFADGQTIKTVSVIIEGDDGPLIALQDSAQKDNTMEKEYLEPEPNDDQDLNKTKNKIEDSSQTETSGHGQKTVMDFEDSETEKDTVAQVEVKTTQHLVGEPPEEQEEESGTEMAQNTDRQNVGEAQPVCTLQQATVVLVDLTTVPPKSTCERETTESEKEMKIGDGASTQIVQKEGMLKKGCAAVEENVFLDTGMEEPMTENLEEQVAEVGTVSMLGTDSKRQIIMPDEILKDDRVGEITLEEESGTSMSKQTAEVYTSESDNSEETTAILKLQEASVVLVDFNKVSNTTEDALQLQEEECQELDKPADVSMHIHETEEQVMKQTEAQIKPAKVEKADGEKVQDAEIDVELETQIQSVVKPTEETEEALALEIVQKEDGQNTIESSLDCTLQKAAVVLVDFNKDHLKRVIDSENAKQSQDDVDKQGNIGEDRNESNEEEKDMNQTEFLDEIAEKGGKITETTQPLCNKSLNSTVLEENDGFVGVNVEEPMTEVPEELALDEGIDNTLITSDEQDESILSEEKLRDDKVGELMLEESASTVAEKAAAVDKSAHQKDDQYSTMADHEESVQESSSEQETAVTVIRNLRRRTVTALATQQRKSKHFQKSGVQAEIKITDVDKETDVKKGEKTPLVCMPMEEGMLEISLENANGERKVTSEMEKQEYVLNEQEVGKLSAEEISKIEVISKDIAGDGNDFMEKSEDKEKGEMASDPAVNAEVEEATTEEEKVSEVKSTENIENKNGGMVSVQQDSTANEKELELPTISLEDTIQSERKAESELKRDEKDDTNGTKPAQENTEEESSDEKGELLIIKKLRGRTVTVPSPLQRKQKYCCKKVEAHTNKPQPEKEKELEGLSTERETAEGTEVPITAVDHKKEIRITETCLQDDNEDSQVVSEVMNQVAVSFNDQEEENAAETDEEKIEKITDLEEESMTERDEAELNEKVVVDNDAMDCSLEKEADQGDEQEIGRAIPEQENKQQENVLHKVEGKLIEEQSEGESRILEEEKQIEEKGEKGNMSATEEITDEVEGRGEVERMRKRTITMKATSERRAKRIRKQIQEANPEHVNVDLTEDPLPVDEEGEEQADAKSLAEKGKEKEVRSQEQQESVDDTDKELLSEKSQEEENQEVKEVYRETRTEEEEDVQAHLRELISVSKEETDTINKAQEGDKGEAEEENKREADECKEESAEHENKSTKNDTVEEIKDDQDITEQNEKNRKEFGKLSISRDESIVLELDEENESRSPEENKVVEDTLAALVECPNMVSKAMQNTDKYEEHLLEMTDHPAEIKKEVLQERPSVAHSPYQKSTRRSKQFLRKSRGKMKGTSEAEAVKDVIEAVEDIKRKSTDELTPRRSTRLARLKVM